MRYLTAFIVFPLIEIYMYLMININLYSNVFTKALYEELIKLIAYRLSKKDNVSVALVSLVFATCETILRPNSYLNENTYNYPYTAAILFLGNMFIYHSMFLYLTKKNIIIGTALHTLHNWMIDKDFLKINIYSFITILTFLVIVYCQETKLLFNLLDNGKTKFLRSKRCNR